MNPIIASYDNRLHRDQVIALWKEVFGYEADHNEPEPLRRKPFRLEELLKLLNSFRKIPELNSLLSSVPPPCCEHRQKIDDRIREKLNDCEAT